MANRKEKKFIRTNLYIQEDIHPELFKYLDRIPPEGRAEKERYLMQLGLLAIKGLNVSSGVVLEDHQQGDLKSSHPNAISAESSKSLPSSDSPSVVKGAENLVSIGQTDLDISDDILSLF